MSFKCGDKAFLYGPLNGFRTNETGETCPLFSGAPVMVLEVRDRSDGYQNVKVRILKHKDGRWTWEPGATGWGHSLQFRTRLIKPDKDGKLTRRQEGS